MVKAQQRLSGLYHGGKIGVAGKFWVRVVQYGRPRNSTGGAFMGFLSRFAGAGLVPMLISYMGSGGALLASSAAQLLTFAILARYLGVEQFGLYAVITAITNVGVQLCGLGAQESLVRRVAQDRAMFPAMLGHAYILSAASGLALVALGMIILPLAAPVSADLATTLTASAVILVTNI